MGWKQYLGIGVVLALITAALLVIAVRTAPPPAPDEGPREKAAEVAAKAAGLGALGTGNITFSGSTMYEADETGQEKWRAKFEGEADVDAKTQTATAKNVRLTVKFEQRQDLILDAPSFEVGFATRKMEFPQGSRLHVSDGSAEFAAHAFTYDMDTGVILGHGGVECRRGPFRMTGEGLRVDTRGKQVEVTGKPAHFERASASGGAPRA